MEFSEQQNQAMEEIKKWYHSVNRKPWFYLAGYAGTGKTTLAKYMGEYLNKRTGFAAFTGKAASVLKSKGCTDARTIHSLIYDVKEEKGEIEFQLKHDSDILRKDLLIVDEVSMVGEELGKDLLSYDRPIIVLGDPAQLPPVKDAGFFTNQEPDFMLTEIHRQALDNPIIGLSIKIRNGEYINYGKYGDNVLVLERDKLNESMLTGAGQILVGKNDTRKEINAIYRELHPEIDESKVIVPKDRLVCLKNDAKDGLFNGTMWEVNKIVKSYGKDRHRLLVKNLDIYNNFYKNVYVHEFFFQGKEDTLDWREKKRYHWFDYGYALTVHKAQGSQWNNVLLFDESGIFREDANKWLYTGVTRAAERVIILR